MLLVIEIILGWPFYASGSKDYKQKFTWYKKLHVLKNEAYLAIEHLRTTAANTTSTLSRTWGQGLTAKKPLNWDLAPLPGFGGD